MPTATDYFCGMRRHDCVGQTGDICARCEHEAEERKDRIERDDRAADREADRYERWLDQIGEGA